MVVVRFPLAETRPQRVAIIATQAELVSETDPSDWTFDDNSSNLAAALFSTVPFQWSASCHSRIPAKVTQSWSLDPTTSQGPTRELSLFGPDPRTWDIDLICNCDILVLIVATKRSYQTLKSNLAAAELGRRIGGVILARPLDKDDGDWMMLEDFKSLVNGDLSRIAIIPDRFTPVGVIVAQAVQIPSALTSPGLQSFRTIRDAVELHTATEQKLDTHTDPSATPIGVGIAPLMERKYPTIHLASSAQVARSFLAAVERLADPTDHCQAREELEPSMPELRSE